MSVIQQPDINKNTVLENLVLFAAATRMVGIDRETGEGGLVGKSRKKKVIQSVIDPKYLAGHRQIKTELFRVCRSYGTRIDVLGAWGIPKDDADSLREKLAAMGARWESLTDDLVLKWDTIVDEWAKANPEFATEIRRLAPHKDEVRKKTKFVFASYSLDPDQIKAMSLDEEFETLPEQAAKEIANQIYDSYAEIGEPSWATRVLKAANARLLLSNIARKAKGLGFLHPKLKEIPVVVDVLLEQLPLAGNIEGLQAIGLRTVLEQLSMPQFLLDHGISVPVLEQPPATTQDPPSPPADPENRPPAARYDW